jgi:hypothetical protein
MGCLLDGLSSKGDEAHLLMKELLKPSVRLNLKSVKYSNLLHLLHSNRTLSSLSIEMNKRKFTLF